MEGQARNGRPTYLPAHSCRVEGETGSSTETPGLVGRAFRGEGWEVGVSAVRRWRDDSRCG